MILIVVEVVYWGKLLYDYINYNMVNYYYYWGTEMEDNIQQRVKKELGEAKGIKKVGVVAAVAAAAPAIGIGIAAENAPAIAKGAIDKIKEEAINGQLRKYNPLFPEEYESKDFNCPNMLMIVDEAQRRNIEVCKGAIGWRSKPNDVEVLHLYDNAVEQSGLTFVPAPMCDTIYYVDPHQKNMYINIDELYETIQQQKLAELSRVAYSLGAKSYSIEIVEEEKEFRKRAAKGGMKGSVKIAKAEIHVESDKEYEKKSRRKAFRTEEFTKVRTPVRPALNWFKGDHNIQGLIEQVCEGDGSLKKSDIQIECAKSAVMSQALAGKVDAAVKKLGVNAAVNVKQEAKSEFASKIYFHIEF